MLQRIRGGVRGKGAYVILAFLALPLAILGFDWIRPNTGGTIAEVNGEEIGSREFNQQVAVERQQLLAEMQAGGAGSEISDQQLANRTLRRLVFQQILLQKVKNTGLRISLESIDREILSEDTFYEDGFFSPQIYQAALRQGGYTPGYYKDTVRKELLIGQLLSPLQNAEFILPNELDRMLRIFDQERDIEYLTTSVDDWLDPVPIGDEDVQEYYDDRPGLFLTKIRGYVGYLFLERKEFYEDVPEEELRAYYEEEILALSEQRYVAHILLENGPRRNDEQAQSELLDLKRQLDEGADFKELARRYSDDIGSAAAGGDLGISDGESFPDAFEQALFALAPGEVSEPVQTEAGWHLLRRLEVPLPPYEQRRDAILEAVRGILSEPPYQALLEEVSGMLTPQFALYSDFAKPRGYRFYNRRFILEEAEEVLARPQVMEVLNRYADEMLEQIEESEEQEERRLRNQLRRDEESLAIDREEAFPIGASELIRLDEDTALVIRIFSLHPPRGKTMEEAREEIVDIFHQRDAKTRAEEHMRQLVEEVRQGGEHSLEEAALAEEYQHHVVPRLQRRNTDENIPGRILNRAFHMPLPEPGRPSISMLTLPEDRYAVIQVKEVRNNEEEEYGAVRRALAEEMSDENGRILANLYQYSLNVTAEVEVN